MQAQRRTARRTDHCSYRVDFVSGAKKLKALGRFYFDVRGHYAREACQQKGGLKSCAPCEIADCELGEPEIFFENAEAHEVFELCLTQWRKKVVFTGQGQAEVKDSLDYTAVLSVADALEVNNKRELLHKIKIMEAAAKKTLAESL